MAIKPNKATTVFIMVVAILLLKAFLFYSNSPPDNRLDTEKTTYDGFVGCGYNEYLQKSDKSCGAACLAMLLSETGYRTAEDDIYFFLNKQNEQLSFSDLEKYINHIGLFSQSLEVAKDYFKNHPTLSILHLKYGHYVVFLQDLGKNVVVFDPAYGKVYSSWKNLMKFFDGKLFYVYERK